MEKEGSISLVGLAWVALIVLKAVGHLNWSWLVTILFPIWFPIATAITILALVIAVSLIILIFVVLFGTVMYLLGIES